ncbi:unnamed protein product [Candida verbasci]|uniref:Rhodanese domain-containing protein n=1 Tax=Candida verbasci TaxID=1227364 RepID=A0A9W4TRB8_9ASCO|nr:unnamed protein product [Candida verbasci]
MSIFKSSIPTLRATLRTTLIKQSSPILSSITTRSLSRSLISENNRIITKTTLSNNVKNFNGLRFYSVLTESPEAKIYKYDDVKDLAAHPDKHPDSILVDVREPVEFSDGHIPNAINIPFKSSPGALDLPEEDFQEIFGFDKPANDKELVFYCLGGVRSTAAEELASTFGYKKRGNYVGSYEDWVSHENKTKTN